MKPSNKKRLQKAHIRRAAVIFVALLAFSLLAYAEVIRPNQHAKAYDSRLQAAANDLHACFLKLADTESLAIFYAPDIPLSQKQANIESVRQSVKQCSGELQRFYYDAQTLQGLYLSGYTGNYKKSQTTKEHALNVAGQSNDVLKQYGQMASFLSSYYEGLEMFTTYTDELNKMVDLSSLQNQTPKLRQQAAELRAQATDIRQLKPAAGFETMIAPTADMIDQAASGFESLANGYSRQNDMTIANGFESIETAVATYNATVQQMSFELLVQAYTTKQVAALPSKVEDLSRAEFE